MKTISQADVTPTTPLRLSTAASLAFPDGSMSVTGLRGEAAKGRLRIEKIAGRLFTTLEAIEEMRELCRVAPNPLASTSDIERVVRPSMSSSIVDLRSAQAAALIASERRKRPSRGT